MLTVHTPALLLALQLLNAIYIGILAGIGMLYFQDLMPGRQALPPPFILTPAWAGLLQAHWRALWLKSELSYGVLDCAGDAS